MIDIKCCEAGRSHSFRHLRIEFKVSLPSASSGLYFVPNAWNWIDIFFILLIYVLLVGGRQSSVVSSAPTILRPQVWIPKLIIYAFFNLYNWCLNEKRTKINEKEAGIGPFSKRFTRCSRVQLPTLGAFYDGNLQLWLYSRCDCETTHSTDSRVVAYDCKVFTMLDTHNCLSQICNRRNDFYWL